MTLNATCLGKQIVHIKNGSKMMKFSVYKHEDHQHKKRTRYCTEGID